MAGIDTLSAVELLGDAVPPKVGDSGGSGGLPPAQSGPAGSPSSDVPKIDGTVLDYFFGALESGIQVILPRCAEGKEEPEDDRPGAMNLLSASDGIDEDECSVATEIKTTLEEEEEEQQEEAGGGQQQEEEQGGVDSTWVRVGASEGSTGRDGDGNGDGDGDGDGDGNDDGNGDGDGNGGDSEAGDAGGEKVSRTESDGRVEPVLPRPVEEEEDAADVANEDAPSAEIAKARAYLDHAALIRAETEARRAALELKKICLEEARVREEMLDAGIEDEGSCSGSSTASSAAYCSSDDEKEDDAAKGTGCATGTSKFGMFGFWRRR